jgi:predicted dehydrogenase
MRDNRCPMTRVGIIGCGGIARFHYEGYEKAGATIAHVCDIRPEAADAVARRYGAKASSDYRAVLEDKSVELVSICSIASTHKQICLDAIAAGKGVVCEKTLTDNAADSLAIAQAAKKAGTFFATAYMKRFFPAAKQAKQLLDQMGPIISIHARSWQPWDLWNQPLGDGLTQHPSFIRKSYGGGVLVCAGSHILDLVHWFGGRPSQATASMYIRDGMDADIRTTALLWLPQGATASVEFCWHPLQRVGMERNGWDERLEINTTTGRLEFYTVTWNNPINPALLIHHDAAGNVTEYRYGVVNPFDAEMKEMLERFQQRQPAWPSATDGYVVDATIAAIDHSARENRIVRIEWGD